MFSRPIVPLLIISSGLNQQRTVNLLQKLRKVNYSNAKAIGVVVELDNHMPVQIDKIAYFLSSVRHKYGLIIYRFCNSYVSAEAYYMFFNSNRLYTTKSTVFQLARGTKTHSAEELMKNLGITKTISKSDDNLMGAGLDSFSSLNTFKCYNQKKNINQSTHAGVFSCQSARKKFFIQARDPSSIDNVRKLGNSVWLRRLMLKLF